MSHSIEQQSGPEHLVLDWLARDRAAVLGDLERLEAQHLDIVYADLHDEGRGVTIVALPDPGGRAHAMALVTVRDDGHHVRYISLRVLAGVALDEGTDAVRLTLSFSGAVEPVVVVAHAALQRGWARDVAESALRWLL